VLGIFRQFETIDVEATDSLRGDRAPLTGQRGRGEDGSNPIEVTTSAGSVLVAAHRRAINGLAGAARSRSAAASRGSLRSRSRPVALSFALAAVALRAAARARA
jgi:hypothetical protein